MLGRMPSPFSSSVAPAAASNAFMGRIAVLKTVSAARIAGSDVLQLEDDRLVALGRDVVDRGDEEAPDAVVGVGGTLQRPVHVFRRDRRAVGEFDAVAQRQT